MKLQGHGVTEPVGRFGTRMHTASVGYIGTLPHFQGAETPYIQHELFGAVIAHRLSGERGSRPRHAHARRLGLHCLLLSS